MTATHPPPPPPPNLSHGRHRTHAPAEDPSRSRPSRAPTLLRRARAQAKARSLAGAVRLACTAWCALAALRALARKHNARPNATNARARHRVTDASRNACPRALARISDSRAHRACVVLVLASHAALEPHRPRSELGLASLSRRSPKSPRHGHPDSAGNPPPPLWSLRPSYGNRARGPPLSIFLGSSVVAALFQPSPRSSPSTKSWSRSCR